MYQKAPISVLRSGTVLSNPIYDDNNGMLLGKGIILTEHFIAGLKRRGIFSVIVEKNELNRMNGDEPTPSETGARLRSGERITSCHGCHGPLDLRRPRRDERATNLECGDCGTTYHALLGDSCPPEMRRRVRPGKFRMSGTPLMTPPEAMAAYVGRLIEEDRLVSENRAEVRYAVSISVTAIPMDEQFRPVGDPFMSITRNLSPSGISLIHTRSVNSHFLATELQTAGAQSIRCMVEVLRCEHIGRFYEIAGRLRMGSDGS